MRESSDTQPRPQWPFHTSLPSSLLLPSLWQELWTLDRFLDCAVFGKCLLCTPRTSGGCQLPERVSQEISHRLRGRGELAANQKHSVPQSKETFCLGLEAEPWQGGGGGQRGCPGLFPGEVQPHDGSAVLDPSSPIVSSAGPALGQTVLPEGRLICSCRRAGSATCKLEGPVPDRRVKLYRVT